MEKMTLYIDYDGVIRDTVRISSEMLGYRNSKTQDEISEFYRKLDWNYLLKISPVLGDAINCIKKLLESGMFDLKILTHVNSVHEGTEKINLSAEELDGVRVITCPKEIEKCDFVDPTNCILVDDYMGNLVLWQEKGGIGVKFSDNNKNRDDIITVTRLDQLLDIDFNKYMNKPKAKVRQLQK